jgi:hypothetical protein
MDLTRLKRFDKTKHEQLEGLLQWCTLMGLTGKDLVSLGGHIDRAQAAAESKSNRALAETITFDPVGADMSMSNKWSYNTPNGRYTFNDTSWGRIAVTSNKTKVRKNIQIEQYQLGRLHWQKRERLNCALNIIHGRIVLDF